MKTYEAEDLIEMALQVKQSTNLSFKSTSLLEKIIKRELKKVDLRQLIKTYNRPFYQYQHLFSPTQEGYLK